MELIVGGHQVINNENGRSSKGFEGFFKIPK
jgi:hypothetical protein